MRKCIVLFMIFYLLGSSICLAHNLDSVVSNEEACDLEGFTPDFSSIIECVELIELIESKKDFFLLDVRNQSEWNTGYIEGATLIPYKEIEDNLDKLPSDKNSLIVIYCKSGIRSGAALETLKKLGYTNLTHLIQGTTGWSFEGYPLVKPDVK